MESEQIRARCWIACPPDVGGVESIDFVILMTGLRVCLLRLAYMPMSEEADEHGIDTVCIYATVQDRGGWFLSRFVCKSPMRGMAIAIHLILQTAHTLIASVSACRPCCVQ